MSYAAGQKCHLMAVFLSNSTILTVINGIIGLVIYGSFAQIAIAYNLPIVVKIRGFI